MLLYQVSPEGASLTLAPLDRARRAGAPAIDHCREWRVVVGGAVPTGRFLRLTPGGHEFFSSPTAMRPHWYTSAPLPFARG